MNLQCAPFLTKQWPLQPILPDSCTFVRRLDVSFDLLFRGWWWKTDISLPNRKNRAGSKVIAQTLYEFRSGLTVVVSEQEARLDKRQG